MRRAIACTAAGILLASLALPAEAGKAERRRKRKVRPEPAGVARTWRWPPSRPMRRIGRACLRELTAAGVDWKRARRRRAIATPIRVPSLEIDGVRLVPRFRDPPFVMDCHLALALARAAPVLRQWGVRELRFSTIHDYRRVRTGGRVGGSLSRHALGLAIDVFEIVDDTGHVRVVDRDYGPYLIGVELALRGSGAFRAVITPMTDPISHDDHFHLDAELELPEPKKKRRRHKRRRR